MIYLQPIQRFSDRVDRAVGVINGRGQSRTKILFVLSMIVSTTFGRTLNSDGSWNDFSQLNEMLENVYEDIYGEYLPGITPAAYGK